MNKVTKKLASTLGVLLGTPRVLGRTPVLFKASIRWSYMPSTPRLCMQIGKIRLLNPKRMGLDFLAPWPTVMYHFGLSNKELEY